MKCGGAAGVTPPFFLSEDGATMILLTKRSQEKFMLNHQQIQCIEMIPETKIVMVNREYFLVRESVEEIIDKIADYNAKVQDIHRQITVVDRR